jgi:hypothetical protein
MVIFAHFVLTPQLHIFTMLAFCEYICYSITTLSPLIVIYRQVMPNHRKIGAFGGRKVKNRAITGNRKNRKSEDFW